MHIPVTGFTSWHWHLRLGYASTRTVEIAALFAAPAPPAAAARR
ncbi:hypothetical protein [Sinorhizobium meliloti]|nr:hypothetical protein [Sinorhizobium meliloti]